MFSMSFENKKGAILKLGDGTPYTVKEFAGLNPPKATVNINESALVDGGTFNSSKLNCRQVNIAIAVEEAAEDNRLAFYKVVQSKMPLRIYYRSDRLDVFMDGYVEDIDVSFWARKNVITVSVICPFPYLKVADQVITDFSDAIDLFHFPFSSTEDPQLVFGEMFDFVSARVENAGNVPCGLTFKLYANGTIENPMVMDRESGDYFQINRTMYAGDLITVETSQGYRKVSLMRDGNTYNIFNDWDSLSTWLQLDVGGNTFVYSVSSGQMSDLVVEIEHYDLFEGV